MKTDTEEPSPAEVWGALQDEGVAGLVGSLMAYNRQCDDGIINGHIDHLERRIAELEDENRRLNNQLRNAERRVMSIFWDDRDPDYGV